MTIKRILSNSRELFPTKVTKNNKETKDLNEILNLADKITLSDLDFKKSFNEQGAILCDIKKMLNSKNSNNKAFQCNPIIKNKLNDIKFNTLYQQFKNDKIPIKLHVSKLKTHTKAKSKLFNKHTRLNQSRTSKSKYSKKKKSGIHKKHSNKMKPEINARYPIVIIKKRGPRKNVFYQNNL